MTGRSSSASPLRLLFARWRLPWAPPAAPAPPTAADLRAHLREVMAARPGAFASELDVQALLLR
jgi:hypothetical protein